MTLRESGEEELLLIHFNKQRIKSFKELINEYLTLDRIYRKGQLFTPYIGTDKNVRLRLNNLTNTEGYWNEYDRQETSNKTDKKKLEKILKGYIEPNIIKKLVELNKSFNGFEEWCKLYKDKKIKGMDFLIE